MTENVIQLRDRRDERFFTQGIAALSSQTWPANRARGDYRREVAEQTLAEPCRVICGRCGKSKNAPLSVSRAWFHDHVDNGKCRKGDDAA